MPNDSRKKTPSEGAARMHLMKAALDLFTEKGYSATSVREIVEAAGVTKPVLYYYFKNKDGIYLELMRESFGPLEQLIDGLQYQDGTVRDRVLAFFDRLFVHSLEGIKVARLIYSIYYGPPQGAPSFDFEAYNRKLHDVIKRMVKVGMKKGELKTGNAEDIVWVLMG